MSDGNQLLCEKHNDPDVLCRGCFNQLKAELEKWKEDAEFLFDWVNHDSDCILTQYQAGEPTQDGGYRVMYKGKWYRTRPIDESPKCNCGLGEVIAAHERMVKG